MDVAKVCKNYNEAFAERMELAGIKPHHRIAIGVSGGPDSMALCILTSHWKCAELGENARTNGCINGLVGLVVDHGLRAKSATEANCVQNWVSKLGIQCDTLKCKWPSGPPKQGHLQEAARNARYKILKDRCRQYQIGVLFVAHHADDQAELFVLRLSRHSGVAGLAGMAFVSQLFFDIPFGYIGISGNQGILLVRPLLHFTKDDLYKICEEAGQQWVEDPTNQNLAFVRNRIRKSLGGYHTCNFRSEVQDLISSCRRLRAFLNASCDHLMEETVSVNEDYGYAVLDVQKLLACNITDLCFSRFLLLLLQFVSQKCRPLRGKVIEMLINYICSYPCKTSLTVGGCYLCPAPGSKGEVEEIIKASKAFLDGLRLFESELPFLHAKDTPTVLAEARRMSLISESTKSRLILLKEEISKEWDDKHNGDTFEVKGQAKELINRSAFENVPISFEQSCYFMNRFIVSWGKPKFNEKHDIGPFDAINGSSVCQNHNNFRANGNCPCAIVIKRIAWIRHMKEVDWNCLSHLAEGQLAGEYVSLCTVNEQKTISVGDAKYQRGQKIISCADYAIGKAREALARLKTVPMPARRGLPVLVNAQGTLLGIPENICEHADFKWAHVEFQLRVQKGACKYMHVRWSAQTNGHMQNCELELQKDRTCTCKSAA